MSKLHSDAVPILDNEAGPAQFRVTFPYARMAVSGPGTLQSWEGVEWDTGIPFVESQAIVAPGRYQITLDAPGNASIQEIDRRV